MKKLDNIKSIEVKELKNTEKVYRVNDALAFCLQNLNKVCLTDLDKTRLVKFSEDQSVYVFYPIFNTLLVLERIYEQLVTDNREIKIDWQKEYEQLKSSKDGKCE